MRRVEKVIDIVHRNITQNDWDNIWIIAADEGKGKSSLALHLLEYWLKTIKGSVVVEDIKYINLDLVCWAKQFMDCQKFDISILDESGELSNKRSMSNLNFVVNKAFQITRGDNLFTILILPSLFDLDGFFTKRRARGFIQVYERGKFAYWSQKKLRRIVDINQYQMVKNVWKVHPSFHDTFPIYKGILLDGYKQKKKEFMKDARKELYDKIVEIKGGLSEEEQEIIRLRKTEKISFAKIAERLDIPCSTVKSKFKRVGHKTIDIT